MFYIFYMINSLIKEKLSCISFNILLVDYLKKYFLNSMRSFILKCPNYMETLTRKPKVTKLPFELDTNESVKHMSNTNWKSVGLISNRRDVCTSKFHHTSLQWSFTLSYMSNNDYKSIMQDSFH